MAKITFIEHGGRRHVVDASNGASVMETAKKNKVPGIDADCGGGCSCGTCHVYIEPEWRDRVGEANALERATLDFAVDVKPNSRLSCQLKVGDAFDGLVVRLPESQR